MKSSLKTLGLIIFVFLSCKQDKKQNLKRDAVNDPDLKYTILTDSEYNMFLNNKYNSQSWKPSKQDIYLVQEIINKAISDTNFIYLKNPEKKIRDDYYKQYIPYINNRGEKMIKINAFCEILKVPPKPGSETNEWTDIDWKNEYHYINDGGNCFWRMTINLETKKYKDIMLNGI